MIYTVTFNPAIDYVVRLDKALEVGEVNRAAGEDCVLGGKGINVSGVLHELGCESVALGFVAGETGAWLERGLAAQGLHTDFIHLDRRHDPHQREDQSRGRDRAERRRPRHPGFGPARAGRKARCADRKRCAHPRRQHPVQYAAGHLRAAAGPAGRQGGALCRGRHPRPAGKRSALPPLPHQAEQPRAGRAGGQES